MIMVADGLPDCKGFLKPVPLSDTARLLVIRMIAGFLLHAGRMSCLQAAGAVRCEARHRAQISRFLARPRWRGMDINSLLRQSLLARESADGPWIDIIDATLCGQAGKKTENTYSTGNRQRRRQKGRRYGKYKHAPRSCHSFTMGLLITPSGMRIPFSKPFHTREYCQQKLARRGLSEEEKRWWRRQRTHGLCQAVRLASQQSELHYLAKRLETPSGIAKLKRLLRNNFAPEYRTAL